MKLLAKYTKLDPRERVKKNNEFIKLLDSSKDTKHPEILSVKEKSDIWNILQKKGMLNWACFYDKRREN